MNSPAPSTGLRRVVGIGHGAAGWAFDLVIGVFLTNLLAAIPLGLVGYVTGNPYYLLTGAWVVACILGIRFMRSARSEAGPAWFGQ